MKMNDSSIKDTLIFSIYKDMGSERTAFFAIVFILYMISVIMNISLMLLLYLDTSLHKPMFLFLFSLVFNGLIGSTAIWPHVMFLLLSEVNSTSYVGCLVQFFLLGSYGGCNYTVLTVMAYDRLVSLFQPLQYHSIMTPQKVKQLLIVANCIPAALVFGQVILTSQITFCKYKLDRLFCDNLSLSSLSCGASFQGHVSNIYGICGNIIFVVIPVFLVFLSYMKILRLCLKTSRLARKKAFETCSPHIIVFINFSSASLFSVIYNRTNSHLPGEAHIFVSMVYILLPPLLHPIIYGIKTQEIRCSILKIKRWLSASV